MPRSPGQLHVLNGDHLKRANERLRRARETYVPSRLPRALKEEGRLMLDFDAATSLEARLKALEGILKLRRLVMDMIGWPKPPTMRRGKLPAALDAFRSQDPLGDIAIDALVVRSEPSEGG